MHRQSRVPNATERMEAARGTQPTQSPYKHVPLTQEDIERRENEHRILLDEALDCVDGWDERVDFDRLLALEFEYNRALALRTVQVAALLMDGRDGRARLMDRSMHSHITIGGLISGDDFDLNGNKKCAFARASTGAWNSYIGGRLGALYSDEDAYDYLALCARDVGFRLWFNQSVDDTPRCKWPDHLREQFTGHRHHAFPPEWRDTWLPTLVDAMSTQTSALTGIEIARTRVLTDALKSLLEARIGDGPLHPIKLRDGESLACQSRAGDPLSKLREPRSCGKDDNLTIDAAVIERHKAMVERLAVSSSRMCQGFATLTVLHGKDPDAIVMGPDTGDASDKEERFLALVHDGYSAVAGWPQTSSAPSARFEPPSARHPVHTFNVTYPCETALCMLRAVKCMTDRYYATAPYFRHLIAPAEYDKMVECAPHDSVLLP